MKYLVYYVHIPKVPDPLIIVVNVRKRSVDNSAPGSALFGKCATDPENNEDLFGFGIHAQLAGCRSNVIQGGTSSPL